MFLQGEIYKINTRTKDYPLFVMVLFDPEPDREMFNAVVIRDVADSHEAGNMANNWFKKDFTLTDWQEVKRWI